MANQLLVRNVPDSLQKWIESQRQQHRMSQQEFVLSLLQRASSLAVKTLALPFERTRDSQPPNDLPFTFVDLLAVIGG